MMFLLSLDLCVNLMEYHCLDNSEAIHIQKGFLGSVSISVCSPLALFTTCGSHNVFKKLPNSSITISSPPFLDLVEKKEMNQSRCISMV